MAGETEPSDKTSSTTATDTEPSDPMDDVSTEEEMLDRMYQHGLDSYADMFGKDPDEESDDESEDDKDDDETKVIDVDSDSDDSDSDDDEETPDATENSASDDATVPAIPPELMAQAEALGISREDAEHTPVSVLSRMVQMATANATDQTPNNEPTNGPLGDGRTEQEVWEFLVGEKSELLPEMKFAMNTVRGQLDRLRAIEDRMIREENTRVVERVNGLFDGVSKELGNTFDMNTAEGRQNRAKVALRMDTIRAEAVKSGQTPPQEAELFRKAVDSEYGEKARAAAEKKATEKVKAQLRRRQGSHVAVPGAGDPASRGDANIAEVQRRVAKLLGHEGPVAPLEMDDLVI